LPPGCERPHNTLAPLRWDSPIVSRVLASEARRAVVAEATGARAPRWISGYVSVKDPRSEPLEWHQDWWCWDHPVSYRKAASQVAVLCYLSGTTSRTAALRVRPGTHRGRAIGGEVTLEAAAGDAVAVDYRLLHGTHPNRSAQRRDALILNFAPEWDALPDDVRAHLIRHPALPGAGERPASESWPVELLPTYSGTPRDLPLSRTAPAEFYAAQ
jgi:ectoine hydroxylase-related dioxygenase (phytanoyl-CoA dioxygenase family)